MASTPPSATPAFLEIMEPSSKGPKGKGTKIEFTFNPKEISVTAGAQWSEKRSKKPAPPEFTGTNPRTVAFEMFFDESEGGEVASRVDKLLGTVEAHKGTETKKPSPPFVAMGWGKKYYIDQAVVTSLNVKFTRFKSTGEPTRATVQVSLKEVLIGQPKQNPTSGSEGIESERVVALGDSLASIANEELGSPTLWRALAWANGIDDPFRLAVGTKLVIPDPSSVGRTGG